MVTNLTQKSNKKLGLSVDVYLSIAEQILKIERRPLSAKAILEEAFRRGIVPSKLYGRTQHKTLQARIAEDIIDNRDASVFFRTSPGRFFLRELIDDQSIPNDLKKPYASRRRFRELVSGPALAIPLTFLRAFTDEVHSITTEKIYKILEHKSYIYKSPKGAEPDLAFIRSFVCVMKGTNVLTYRVGRYREDRDTFALRRTIGFSTLVHSDHPTLFNPIDLGILDAGVHATKADLDITPTSKEADDIEAALTHFFLAHETDQPSCLLALIHFKCPDWFEPTRRRLALNEIHWMDLCQRVNNLDDYDPWSQIVLKAIYEGRNVLSVADD